MSTWPEFHHELFRKILEYESKPSELKRKVGDAFAAAGANFIYPNDVMDPISPVSMASSYGIKMRLRIYEQLSDAFNIELDLPEDFEGMPTIRRNTRFVPDFKDVPDADIWPFFKVVMDFCDEKSNKEQFIQSFDMSIIPYVTCRTLSIALFWIDPERFITLDSSMCEYLADRFHYSVPEKFKGSEYVHYCEELQSKIKEWGIESFLKLSELAWDDKKIKIPLITKNAWSEMLSDSNIFRECDIELLNRISDNGYVFNSKHMFQQNLEEKNQYENQIVELARCVLGYVSKNIEIEPPHDVLMSVLFEGSSPLSDGSIDWKLCKNLRNVLKKRIPSDTLIPKSVVTPASNRSYAKNTIFYGPPGTGKTYLARRRAVEIILGREINGNDDFRELYSSFSKEGKIGFVTFHQSFSYEEFVEGIRPVLHPGDQNPTYEVCDGLFKTFCKNASNAMKGDDLDIREDAIVWKVSLGGTKDNPIRSDCLKNNRIRVDYAEYTGDLSEISLPPALNAMINTMSVGDIIFSCYTENTIDAIGMVTGEFEVNGDFTEYQKMRSVRWIKKFKTPINILELNGNTKMTLSTVYQLFRISKKDVLALLGKTVSFDDSPRVFIIDEINRGNISRIFGELITLLEDKKRAGEPEELTSMLPYSRTSFSIPSNVYVIGTMNTADRSLTNLDTALRRRFSFEEMMPDSGLLPYAVEADGKEIHLQSVLDTINRRIEVLYDRDHAIGHSYLMNVENIQQLDEVFRDRIMPLLQEYFYDDYQKIFLVLSKKGDSNVSRFVKAEKTDDVFPNRKAGTSYSFIEPTGDPDAYISLYDSGSVNKDDADL